MIGRRTISELRDLMPLRQLSQREALHLAKLQAARLLSLGEVTDGPVPEGLITELPQVDVRYAHSADAPASGVMHWKDGRYLIVIDHTERPIGRCRFSLAHELKHALDHPYVTTLYPALSRLTSKQRQEQVCDYFAACLLMPRPWVVRAWVSGVQDIAKLCNRFEVSGVAMERRLRDLGLTEPAVRCGAAA
jgi:Zn-dependent peptidase ImmA (M78 family)